MGALVEVKVERGAALMTISRPEAMNALNREVLEALDGELEGLRERPEVRCVIVTGAGEKAFVAGADIKEMTGLSSLKAKDYSRRGQALMDRIEDFPRPVIAAVNGYCLGGGCELALACHLRVAASGARLGQPEVGLGLIPGFGGTQRLSRVVGRARALELILTGEAIEAARAAEIGLVNRVVSADELLETCYSLAERIGRNSPAAVKLALEAVLAGAEMPRQEALALEAVLFGQCFATEDFSEGISAFVEKRKPHFKGK